jgi:hypothetical protein
MTRLFKAIPPEADVEFMMNSKERVDAFEHLACEMKRIRMAAITERQDKMTRSIRSVERGTALSRA